MAKGLPVKVHLRQVSQQHNAYAILFHLFDDVWQIEKASILSNQVVLVRCSPNFAKDVLNCPEQLIDIQPNKFGVNTNGYAYPIKKVYHKANLLRFIRQDPKRKFLSLKRKIRILVTDSGYLLATDGNSKIASIAFNAQSRVPISISRVLFSHRKAKRRPYRRDEFLLDVYGTVLRRLDDVITRVMQDTTVFADPLEMKTQAGRQYLTLHWNRK